MQTGYNIISLDDIEGLSKQVKLSDLSDYSLITLQGKKLTKAQIRELRQNVMKWFNKNAQYGKTVKNNMEKVVENKIATMLPINSLYPSPNKWNFYDILDDNKKLELMESIQINGVLSPIIVWEKPYVDLKNEYDINEDNQYNLDGDRYVILAGHNRVDACAKLYQATGDKKYLKILAFIFEKNEIGIDVAREIVVDTNYVQRNLSTKEKVKSVMFKYAELEKNKSQKGRTKEIIAEALNMSPSMVQNYKRLSGVIEPLQNMVYDEKLTLTSVLKVSDKTKDLQQWLYDTYKDVMTSKILNKIKPSMKRENIIKLFENEMMTKESPMKQVTFEIPEHLEDKARKLIANLIERNKKKS